jgi:hypothetical protein
MHALECYKKYLINSGKQNIACLTIALMLSTLASTTVFSLPNACPKPIKIDDPFSSFDDILSDEEKRAELHKDLDRKLARHNAPCDPTIKQSKPSQEQASATAPNPSQNQTDDQKGEQNSKLQATQTNSQESTKAPSEQASPSTTSTNNNASEINEGNYSSPWANHSTKNDDQQSIALEPMETNTPQGSSASTSSSQSPPTSVQTIDSDTKPSLPSSSISGADDKQQKTKTTSSTTAKTESEFLKKYGTLKQSSPQSIEDIADQYKNRNQYGFGTPGNTGPNTQTPNYSDPQKNTDQATTISANEAVLVALEKRLTSEQDPEKRKEIQAEIDRYKKK